MPYISGWLLLVIELVEAPQYPMLRLLPRTSETTFLWQSLRFFLPTAACSSRPVTGCYTPKLPVVNRFPSPGGTMGTFFKY